MSLHTGCWSHYKGEMYDVIDSEEDLKGLFHCIEANLMSKKNLADKLRAELEAMKEETYRDEEVARLNAQIAKLREEAYYGFTVTKAESDRVQEWRQKHDTEVHKNPKGYHGVSGGGYTYKFYPTAIGTFWNCTCDTCHRKALDVAYASGKYDAQVYKEYMESHGGKIEFDDV